MRQQTHTIHPQILCEKLNVVIYVPLHAQFHIAKEHLVDPNHRLVHSLGQNVVHALVQPLRKKDLVSDEGRGVIFHQRFHVGQPVGDVRPLSVQGECLEGFP